MDEQAKPVQPQGQGVVMANFGKWFGEGISLVTSDYVNFLVCGLVALLLSMVTCGVLSAPMAIGMIIVTIKKLKGKPISVNDLFQGFQKFGSAIVVWLCMVAAGVALVIVMLILSFTIGFIPFIGPVIVMLCYFPVVIVFVVAMACVGFAYFYIADRNTPPIEAIKSTIELIKKEPVGTILYLLVAALLGGAAFCFTVGFRYGTALKLYENLVGIQSDPQ